MDSFAILGRVGEGAHGVVFKAKHIQSGELVALKKIYLKKIEDGIPNNVLREIKALQAITEHQNIVRLLDVFPDGSSLVLVFEYMITDLSEVLKSSCNALPESHIKSFMMMLLRGISFCHMNRIIHRDLKPANLLISSSGRLKLADFGLARIISIENERLYSHQVATRWYRAPELLYGSREYDEGVDLWAVGCIFAELINKSPLFPGDSDIKQLGCVLSILGTPTASTWPGITKLPDYHKITFTGFLPMPFEDIVPDATKEAQHLLKQFLVYQSKKRISAVEALVHPYFFKMPLAAYPSELLMPHRYRSLARNEKQVGTNISLNQSIIEQFL